MNNKITRTNQLIVNKLNKFVVLNVISSVTKVLLICVDSIIAGKYIGISALAAIALVTLFTAIDEMLHCLFGYGCSSEIAQKVGRGDVKSANRIIATTIVTIFLSYFLIFFPVLLFAKSILSVFSSDELLINNAVKYLIPTIIAMPFFEVMLCVERAYKIDGRAYLFAARPIINTLLNIVLDLVFVLIFDIEIEGLAFASIISTLISYIIVLSHGLTKECTIHPDFSVLKNFKECISYIKINIIRGGTVALDEGLNSIVVGMICKVILASGGSLALAIWNIFSVIKDTANAFVLGLTNSTNLFGNVFYGKEDYKGVKYIAKKGFVFSFVIGFLCYVLIFLTIPFIGEFYGLEKDALLECVTLIRISSFALFFMVLNNYLKSFFDVVRQFKTLYKITVIEELCAFVFPIIGSFVGLKYIFLLHSSFYPLIFLIIAAVFNKKHSTIFPTENSSNIAEYSIILEPSVISDICIDLKKRLIDHKYSEKGAMFVPLLIDECSNLIRNKNINKKVNEDIQVYVKSDKIIILITDDGILYDSIFDFKNKDNVDKLEIKLIKNIACETSYNRIIDLNHIVLKLFHGELR